MKVDPATGAPLDAQWIDGSAPTAVAITLSGGNVWLTGLAIAPDIPITPGTILPRNLGTGLTSGSYLAAAQFSDGLQPGIPAIACVLDGGNLEHVRTIAGFQVISLFGKNLGPSLGMAAADGADLSASGVSVTFGGVAAPLLYVSSSQINVEVPMGATPVMQVTVNGVRSIQRQFPRSAANLNLFANLASNEIACPSLAIIAGGFQPLAMNADGSINSCANPATPGGITSFFVHGVGVPNGGQPPPTLPLELQASIGTCSTPVLHTQLTDGFVYRVDVQLPSPASSCASESNRSVAALGVTFRYDGVPVGPLVVPPPPGVPIVNFTPGQSMPMVVWVRLP